MFYKRMIVSLDLDVNEVVYLRRAGKVMGAKYLGLESTGSMGTRHLFLRADGITETIYIGCGASSTSKSVYLTIEDAIHDKPIRERHIDITGILQGFGFYLKRREIGCIMLGKDMWRWDGYQPICSHLSHEDFKITWDGEWNYKYIGAKGYCDSLEECKSNNHVDVITF